MSRSRTLILLALVASLLFGFSSAARPEPAIGGGNIVVDTNLNNDVADGLCSLREAIIAANTNVAYQGCATGVAGTDFITFALGAQSRTISVATELPTITAPMFIDGGPEKIELRGPGGAIVSGDDGLTITGSDVRIHNLVINSFRDVGILSNGANTQLEGNLIGTDVTGTIAMPNQGFGVQIHSTGAIIGGSRGDDTICIAPCNLISGNAKDGILLDNDSSSAAVLGNFIGTDITGTTALVEINSPLGVGVKGDFHTVGSGLAVLPGACLGGCNVITGGTGVFVAAGADTTSVGNNFIGTDVSGSVALQPSGIGVHNRGHHTFVGGEPNVAGNLISGWGTGVFAEEDLLFVEHNFIGTNFDGTTGVPNAVGIISSSTMSTLIQNENVISGNSTGVILNNATGVQIRNNNLIGLAADGESRLGNLNAGVRVVGTSNLNSVGQVDGENEIAFNGDGVRVEGATAIRNIIGANSIHDNDALGIDNVNGGNTELAPPTITFASVAGAAGTTCPTCVVQVFSDEVDEGRVYEGVTTADGTGAWTFPAPVGELLAGPNVTATTMDPLLNTSEFSQPFVIFEPTPSATPTPEPTETATPTPTPTPTGQQVAWGDNNCSGTPPDPVDSLLTLRFDAGLSTNTGDCPPMGEVVEVAQASPHPWGDVDCSGEVNPVDSLKLLRFDAGLPVVQPISCPELGATVVIS